MEDYNPNFISIPHPLGFNRAKCSYLPGSLNKGERRSLGVADIHMNYGENSVASLIMTTAYFCGQLVCSTNNRYFSRFRAVMD